MTYKKTAARAVAEIDHAELTIRLLEIGVGLRRPIGMTGAEALHDVKHTVNSGKIPAYIVADFEKMAVAAMTYLAECINNMKSVS